MDLKSIIYKALFICMIILFFFSLINNKTIDMIVDISMIPVFIINIIVLMNSISIEIQEKTNNIKQYHKKFENDENITREEKENHIKEEIIYDKINCFFRIKFSRILSWILVILIVIFLMMMIFKNYFYSLLSKYKFNTISILSLILLILDVYYKEKISNKVIKTLYNRIIQEKN